MMNIYIVTYECHAAGGGCITYAGVGAVYFTEQEAKDERDRLEAANSWTSARILTRVAVRPREWTPEQKRWMRGAK